MTNSLGHRGPDAAGQWVDLTVGLALGHRRLSIVDLSAAGNQPMQSRSARYQIVFNGEIYNHQDIRLGLEAAFGPIEWRGHSDTETLLEAIEAYGLSAALKRCIGMFAVAVWDRKLRRLALARDRAGEKPLYYGRCGRAFIFGSELKALAAYPGFRGEIDRVALGLFMRYSYVPEPYCIYKDIRKLPPGSLIEVEVDGQHSEPTAYWPVLEMIEAARSTRFMGTDDQAVGALEELLERAVGLQMVADVPVGAFLSGGIDSSLIVALMQKQSVRRVSTFTIGFAERAYDESPHARAVAAHLGTDHNELLVTPQQAMDVIPRLPLIYDEPFADASQIPTFLVSELARRQVKVSLSGDGGDELFGGYTRYSIAGRLLRQFRCIPGPLLTLLASGIRSVSPQSWSRLVSYVSPMMPSHWRAVHVGDKLHKLANVMTHDPVELYLGLVSHWHPAIVRGNFEQDDSALAAVAGQKIDALEEDMMYWDLMTYLPGDILTKVDRASMAVSLESRIPMLDHRVIEFAWSLPLRMRIRNGDGKWILKKLLSRYVPPKLTDRPKSGFGIPIDAWLRGPLRSWAENLLSEGRLRNEGLLDPAPIRIKWREHLEGSRNWSYWLWDILMFESWLEDRDRSAKSGGNETAGARAA